MLGQTFLASIWQVLAQEKFMSNELWRWGALLGLLLAALVVGKVLSFVLARHGRKMMVTGRGRLIGTLLDSLAGPIGVLLVSAALYAGGYILKTTTASVQTVAGETVKVSELELLIELPIWLKVCQAFAVVALGWFIFKLVDLIEVVLSRWTSRTETTLDDQLVPLIRKALRIFVVIVVALFVIQNVFDQQIGPLVAGLGIGGLAFALAAKDLLSNLFGSVTIFSDRPFQLGDRIMIAGHDGMVEEVGFRSTRIRTLMGHQVVVPNSVVANEAVENIGRRPYLKRTMEIAVTYDTPPDKLQRGVEIIREMLEARSDSFPEDMPAKVFFGDFAASSLNIIVYYWYSPPQWWDYLAFNHDFNMELLRRFNEEGIEFAFPTQTVHVKGS